VNNENMARKIGGDIWEGKRTLVLIHLLNDAATPKRRNCENFWGHTPR
jgi:hypothetical protein